MIVFSSLQIRRGVRVLLDNATATINPGQKVGLVGKNGCGKSTLLSLLKNEISADGGSMTFPAAGSWPGLIRKRLRLRSRLLTMLLMAIANSASWRRTCTKPTNVMTAMPSRRSTVSWTPSTPGPSARVRPACSTGSVSATNSLKDR